MKVLDQQLPDNGPKTLLEYTEEQSRYFARRFFAMAMTLDPSRVGEQFVSMPTNQLGELVTDHVVTSFPDMSDDNKARKIFFETGLYETTQLLDPFVLELLKTRGLQAARNFVTHPDTASSVAEFAQHAQSETKELLANKDDWLSVDDSRQAAGGDIKSLPHLDIPASVAGNRCPFSVETSKDSAGPYPIFERFVGWAGLVLVASKTTPQVIALDKKLKSRKQAEDANLAS